MFSGVPSENSIWLVPVYIWFLTASEVKNYKISYCKNILCAALGKLLKFFSSFSPYVKGLVYPDLYHSCVVTASYLMHL